MTVCKGFIVFFIMIMYFFPGQTVSAELSNSADVFDFMGSLDFNSINDVVSDSTYNDSFSFGDYVWSIVKGDATLSLSSIGNAIKNSLTNEFSTSMSILMKLLAIAVISAIFTNFSHTFHKNQIAETGYFVIYILLIGILTTTYMAAAELTKNVLENLVEFMKVMVPVYSMSIVFCAGSGTSVIFYQAVMILITLVDFFLLKAILPLIHLYIMAMFANFLTEEEILSKLAELIGTIIKWILKTILALVIGIGTIQSLIAPAIDHVKSSTVIKWAQAIPGIGGLLGGVTETILGAGSLLKNAIGAAGVIAVIVILAVPLIKLTAYIFLYKASCAVIQPLADKRILSSINSCAESTLMLLKTAFVAGVLFLIVIVMAAVSTTMYL